jgi:hypothetical protein
MPLLRLGLAEDDKLPKLRGRVEFAREAARAPANDSVVRASIVVTV